MLILRDEKELLKTSLAKYQKQQIRLEEELKEKESELEDLGCWRWLLAKVDNVQIITRFINCISGKMG